MQLCLFALRYVVHLLCLHTGLLWFMRLYIASSNVSFLVTLASSCWYYCNTQHICTNESFQQIAYSAVIKGMSFSFCQSQITGKGGRHRDKYFPLTCQAFSMAWTLFSRSSVVYCQHLAKGQRNTSGKETKTPRVVCVDALSDTLPKATHVFWPIVARVFVQSRL